MALISAGSPSLVFTILGGVFACRKPAPPPAAEEEGAPTPSPTTPQEVANAVKENLKAADRATRTAAIIDDMVQPDVEMDEDDPTSTTGLPVDPPTPGPRNQRDAVRRVLRRLHHTNVSYGTGKDFGALMEAARLVGANG